MAESHYSKEVGKEVKYNKWRHRAALAAVLFLLPPSWLGRDRRLARGMGGCGDWVPNEGQSIVSFTRAYAASQPQQGDRMPLADHHYSISSIITSKVDAKEIHAPQYHVLVARTEHMICTR
jgi:hypothetical protein